MKRRAQWLNIQLSHWRPSLRRAYENQSYAAKIRVIGGEKVEIENLTFAPIKLLGVRQL